MGRKKKSGTSQNQVAGGDNPSPPVVDTGINLDSSALLKRAHEIKEEGNSRFQAKDYVGALQQYEDALKLIPNVHPDRAVFHSNKAACLMQMKPIDYDAVISECTFALQVQPQFVRALLRRARAFEAIGKYELAMQDVQSMLIADPNHHDALEIAGRLRMALGPRQETQQDLQSRPSPAALGASAVRGVPVAGLGPSLPARPVPKKPVSSVAAATVPSNKSEKLYPIPPVDNDPGKKKQLPKGVLKSSNGSSVLLCEQAAHTTIRWRPLKLVYDHDIRLAQMPVNCSLRVLREVVGKRFPMSKAVLIKYKDNDGDLVTITSTRELRMAESCVDNLIQNDTDADKGDSIGMLKLHIVEVSPGHEPPLLEDEEDTSLVSETVKGDENVSQHSLSESAVEAVHSKIDNTEKVAQKEKTGRQEDADCKEVEMDDWLFEFAQLFRTHVGVDPDGHIDLHELGMELCSEALEETVTSDQAQNLFNKAALKFQEVAALAFFNWANVHMCEARKRIPIDGSPAAYDWVREKYSRAKEKYEKAILIKPDFYEGLLALGQQQFEMAKLHWLFELSKKEDLSKWDPTETILLFDSAEEKLKAATGIWEKLEEQRANELKDPTTIKKDELLKLRKKQGGGAEGDSSGMGGQGDISPEEAAEQAAVMRSQIHLFWGNMLFERSQLESKLGLPGWKKNLDVAVERFRLAGASETDISTVLSNHCSNEKEADEHEKKADSYEVKKGDN
ncbi:protein CLMP1 [Sesamum alatum]|uniref:Protein CLMP1 n=1 Tax=Sesamum alatum TaxID=300844 RepID=A0AAE2CZ51_9LAMI|nr:protein CLMP1 [Sesamum alatum]